MTQDDLAGNQFSKSYISQIEKGRINPSIKALNIIAERLNTHISYFLKEDGNPDDDYYESIQKGEKLINQCQFSDAFDIFNSLAKNIDYFSNFYKGIILYNLGYIIFKTDKPEKASIYILESIKYLKKSIAEHNDDFSLLLDIYIKLAESYYILNQKNKTLDYLIKGKELYKQHQLNKEKYHYILRNISILNTQKNQYKTAIHYINKLIEISRQDKVINVNILSSYITLAICYYYLQQYDQSIKILEDIIPVCKLLDCPKQIANIHTKIAKSLIMQENYEAAIENISKSMKYAARIKENDIREFIMLNNKILLATINLYQNKIEITFKNITDILKEIESHNREDTQYVSLLGNIYLLAGKTYLKNNEYRKAKYHLKKSITLYEKIGVYNEIPEACKLLGDIYIKTSKLEKAQIFYNRAIELATDRIDNFN